MGSPSLEHGVQGAALEQEDRWLESLSIQAPGVVGPLGL